jgi:GDP-L-fucose synthase
MNSPETQPRADPPPLADPASWRGKRVVVTGGSGFIGSHHVERLLPFAGSIVVPTRQAGVPRHLASVTSAARGGTGEAPASAVEFIHGNLEDAAVCDAAFRRADVALLLAASVGGIAFNAEHPASLLRDNVRVFLASMEAARRHSVGRVLVVSSACVYPRECTIPTPESEGFLGRPEPTNEGYGWAKRMEEFLAASYAREFGMSVAVARPYNAYGPRDNFDPDSSHVIPALIRKAFDPAIPTIEVWGSGEQSRSFLYVTDFVDGLIRICEQANDAEPTNLGTDEETPIGEIARRIADLSGTGKPIVFDRSKPEGQPRRNCDTTRLARLFDFRARVPLETGLAATVAHYRDNLVTGTSSRGVSVTGNSSRDL